MTDTVAIVLPSLPSVPSTSDRITQYRVQLSEFTRAIDGITSIMSRSKLLSPSFAPIEHEQLRNHWQVVDKHYTDMKRHEECEQLMKSVGGFAPSDFMSGYVRYLVDSCVSGGALHDNFVECTMDYYTSRGQHARVRNILTGWRGVPLYDAVAYCIKTPTVTRLLNKLIDLSTEAGQAVVMDRLVINALEAQMVIGYLKPLNLIIHKMKMLPKTVDGCVHELVHRWWTSWCVRYEDVEETSENTYRVDLYHTHVWQQTPTDKLNDDDDAPSYYTTRRWCAVIKNHHMARWLWTFTNNMTDITKVPRKERSWAVKTVLCWFAEHSMDDTWMASHELSDEVMNEMLSYTKLSDFVHFVHKCDLFRDETNAFFMHIMQHMMHLGVYVMDEDRPHCMYDEQTSMCDVIRAIHTSTMDCRYTDVMYKALAVDPSYFAAHCLELTPFVSSDAIAETNTVEILREQLMTPFGDHEFSHMTLDRMVYALLIESEEHEWLFNLIIDPVRTDDMQKFIDRIMKRSYDRVYADGDVDADADDSVGVKEDG